MTFQKTKKTKKKKQPPSSTAAPASGGAPDGRSGGGDRRAGRRAHGREPPGAGGLWGERVENGGGKFVGCFMLFCLFLFQKGRF